MLNLLGWKSLDQTSIKIFRSIEKSIAIFPHTSLWDMFSLLIYVFTHKELNKIFWVVANEEPKWHRSWYKKWIIPNYINMLLVSAPENTKVNLIDSACHLLKNQPKYSLLISPEGSCKREKWKSGYLVLSRKLRVPIVVIGFDFHLHCMTITGVIKPNWEEIENLEDEDTSEVIVEDWYHGKNKTVFVNKNNFRDVIEPELQYIMSLIAPLNPKNSWVQVKDKPVSVLGHSYFTIFSFFLLILLIIFGLIYLLTPKSISI